MVDNFLRTKRRFLRTRVARGPVLWHLVVEELSMRSWLPVVASAVACLPPAGWGSASFRPIPTGSAVDVSADGRVELSELWIWAAERGFEPLPPIPPGAPAGGRCHWWAYLAARAHSMRTSATSGRVNSTGGRSPLASRSRTAVPDRLTMSPSILG